MLDRIGQNVVVARQAVELGAGLGVDAAKALLRDRRRHAIRLGEDDVEADGDGAELGDARDQIGQGGARPRPLPDRLEAGLVDIDDDDRPCRLLARPQHLKQIESAHPQFLERPRIGEPQRHQREQQHDAHRARHAELSRPAGYPVHGRQIPWDVHRL